MERLKQPVMAGTDDVQLVGILHRQVFQHDGIEHAEDRGRRADAERERQDGDDGEAREPSGAANGVPQVMHKENGKFIRIAMP